MRIVCGTGPSIQLFLHRPLWGLFFCFPVKNVNGLYFIDQKEERVTVMRE